MIRACLNTIAQYFADQQQNRWMGAVATSTALHVAVLAALATFWVVTEPIFHGPTLNSKWTPRDATEREAIRFEEIETVNVPQTAHRGGARAGLPNIARKTPVATVSAPNVDLSLASAWFGNQFATDQLAEEVGEIPALGASTAGSGDGNGEDDGKGNGFFGLATKGETFVFVLDCSNSMNHPHDSEAKTRFRRLKLELVNSIASMKPDQRFFIIFFNHQAIPMPASSLQRAIPELQERFLYWTHTVRAIGDTDPRLSLDIALRFQPDVIYFLTDGDFERPIKKDLWKLQQKRTAIHTFAFGNRSSEQLLKDIAANNKGAYHYIP